VPLWRNDLVDAIETVSTDVAVAMALRLAREEGLFAGASTGANVVAALRLAERLGPEATIVTLMCDTGMKYLRRRPIGRTSRPASRRAATGNMEDCRCRAAVAPAEAPST